ncbi:hypothetical protein [uncultured Sphaerochaeta sp.]|uniref:hypothetical protein n=1 Tax=uncultured Sphaerochaeta sp. TaxID=886478 RepID=UPI002A0A1084|nr:hypothetical protein [uncultured Sphaerochaeta sp.]
MIRHTTGKQKKGIIFRIAPSFTIICGLFTLYIIWGLSYSLQDGIPLNSMWHLVVMALLAALGALYRDSWSFDSEQKTISSFYGFGFIGKKAEYSFDEIERIELTHFVRGSVDKDAKPTKRRLKAMVVLSLRFENDSVKDLEIIQEKSSGGRTEAAAQALSAATGLGLYVDRPRDLDLKVGLRDF